MSDFKKVFWTQLFVSGPACIKIAETDNDFKINIEN